MTTLTRAQSAKRALRRDLEALRQEARPEPMRTNLLPDGWHPAKSGLEWSDWLTQLDEGTTFNGQVLTPSAVERMIVEAEANEAAAKAAGTYREPKRMSDAEWAEQCAERYAEQIKRQRALG